MVAAETVLGLSEGAFVAIAVAVITAMATVGVAMIQTARRAERKAEEAAAAIGTPDGQGNVVEMLEKILAGQTGQDSRLAQHDQLFANHHGRLTAHAERLDDHGRRIEDLERWQRGEG